MTTTRQFCDLAEIQRALSVIVAPGSVTELRAPKTRQGTQSGYFTDIAKMTQAAARLSGQAAGVYVTLNPVDPKLKARADNHIKPYATTTTGDVDILHRHWLLVDFDAKRPSGISSTDTEHEAAILRAREAREYLVGFGGDSIILGDSGNGGHLLLRIDLPNDKEATTLCQRCLQALDFRFSDDVVQVDLTTYNAARISKIYGTLTAKGDNTVERPHRIARLSIVPEKLTPLSRNLLEKLASTVPARPNVAPAGGQRIDLAAWLAKHDISIHHKKQWQGGTLFVLSECPWNPEHNHGEAFTIQFGNGAIDAGCHHASCKDWKWVDLRRKYEPESATEPMLAEGTAGIAEGDWAEPFPFPELEGPEFPLEALPEDLSEIVRAHAEGLQVPPGMSAGLGLGTLNAALGGKAVVRPRVDWIEPVNEFNVVVLPPSERKSAAFRTWLNPLEEREREARTAALPEIAAAEAELEVLQTRFGEAKKLAAKASGEQQVEAKRKVQEMAREVAEYRIPTLPRFLADDATPEAVTSLLAEHGGRITIASSEGGLFETIAGRYSDNIPNLDVYLKGHSGDTLRVDRKSRPSEYVPHPALSLILTVQPAVLYAINQRKVFRGRGLLSRFLYEVPRPRRGYRNVNPAPMPTSLQEAWDERVRAILRLPQANPGKEPNFTLASDATDAFLLFLERVEMGLRPNGEYNPIEDWGGKFAGHVLRLAAAIHSWEYIAAWGVGGPLPWDRPISITTIQRAITIGDHYANHALVSYSMMRDSGQTEQARQLWDYLKDRGQPSVSLRDLWRHVRRRFSSTKELKEILEKLQELQYLRLVEKWAGPQGGRPSTWVLLNPLASKSGDNGDKTSSTKPLKGSFVTIVTGNEDGKDDSEMSPAVAEAQQPPPSSETNPGGYEEIF